jgi:alpha-N-acetylglucosamine transferase
MESQKNQKRTFSLPLSLLICISLQIENPHEKHYYFKERLRFAFSKMNIFDQTEYEQIAYLDADMLVVASKIKK